jgi:MFS family permease
MDDKKLSLKRLWVLMVTAFVDMIGYALIMPLLPFYATRYGASPFVVGLLMAIFALAQMIAAPLWGRVSDRLGRRPVILISQALAAVAYVVFAFAPSVLFLLLSRFLQGVGSGSTSVISAYVSDSVGPEERAKALGWITACTSAGVMVGPAIGSFSVGYGYYLPGLISAGLCCINILFAWRWLPESAPRGDSSHGKPSIRGQIWEVLLHPAKATSSLILFYAAGMMSFMAMNAVMALFLASRFGITEHNIGWFYFSVGLVSMLMRAFALGPLVKRFGEVRLLRAGTLVLGMGMISAPLAATPAMFLFTIIMIPAGTALLFPTTTSLVSRYSDPEIVGQTMGVQQAFGGMSRLLAPIWAGAAFQYLGEPIPFWLAGALVLLAGVFSLRLRPRETPRPPIKNPAM